MLEYKLTGNLLLDYFIMGGFSGFVGYLYYVYRNHVKESKRTLILGSVISFPVGGLLGVVIDRDIRSVIITGMFSMMIYNTFVKMFEGNQLVEILREVLIGFLSGGKSIGKK